MVWPKPPGRILRFDRDNTMGSASQGSKKRTGRIAAFGVILVYQAIQDLMYLPDLPLHCIAPMLQSVAFRHR